MSKRKATPAQSSAPRRPPLKAQKPAGGNLLRRSDATVGTAIGLLPRSEEPAEAAHTDSDDGCAHLYDLEIRFRDQAVAVSAAALANRSACILSSISTPAAWQALPLCEGSDTPHRRKITLNPPKHIDTNLLKLWIRGRSFSMQTSSLATILGLYRINAYMMASAKASHNTERAILAKLSSPGPLAGDARKTLCTILKAGAYSNEFLAKVATLYMGGKAWTIHSHRDQSEFPASFYEACDKSEFATPAEALRYLMVVAPHHRNPGKATQCFAVIGAGVSPDELMILKSSHTSQ